MRIKPVANSRAITHESDARVEHIGCLVTRACGNLCCAFCSSLYAERQFEQFLVSGFGFRVSGFGILRVYNHLVTRGLFG
jgi:hypothetical protein